MFDNLLYLSTLHNYTYYLSGMKIMDLLDLVIWRVFNKRAHKTFFHNR